MRLARVPLWCWWIGIVLLVSAPWIGFTPEVQWDRLNLVPFADPKDKPKDLILNVGLFVPFGVSFMKNYRGRRRIAATLAAAAAVSICAEAPQLFSTLRHPSTTDVLAAVAGALAGASLRWFLEKALA
jgi:glycopeptide antibiotics resistance protein